MEQLAIIRGGVMKKILGIILCIFVLSFVLYFYFQHTKKETSTPENPSHIYTCTKQGEVKISKFSFPFMLKKKYVLEVKDDNKILLLEHTQENIFQKIEEFQQYYDYFIEQYPDVEKEYSIQKNEKDKMFTMTSIIKEGNRNMSEDYMDQLKEEGYICVITENLE